jgi:hypothetical protein
MRFLTLLFTLNLFLRPKLNRPRRATLSALVIGNGDYPKEIGVAAQIRSMMQQHMAGQLKKANFDVD